MRCQMLDIVAWGLLASIPMGAEAGSWSATGLAAPSSASAKNTWVIRSDDRVGLPVGAEAPDFTLSDQDGRQVTLKELLKKGPVALVFYRSADW